MKQIKYSLGLKRFMQESTPRMTIFTIYYCCTFTLLALFVLYACMPILYASGTPAYLKYLEATNQCLVLCGGEFNKRAMIAHVRHLRSLGMTMRVFVAHCSEIKIGDNELKRWGIKTFNLCNETTSSEQQKYLRSWFCKPAAMGKAPPQCDKVVITDVDTVFFTNPEIVFDNAHMRKYGLFFLRDKIMEFKKQETGLSRRMITRLFNKFGGEMTSWHQKWLTINSQAWQGIGAHDGESSVVAIDRIKNPSLVTKLDQMIDAQLNLTGGDKEYFWLARLLSGKTYEFTPLFNSIAPGSFGKSPTTACYNIFHRIQLMNGTIIPLHANLQEFIEKYEKRKFNSHEIATDMEALKYSSKLMSHASYVKRYGENVSKSDEANHCFRVGDVELTEEVILEHVKRKIQLIQKTIL